MLSVYKYAIPAHLTRNGAQFQQEFTLSIPKGKVLKLGMQKSRSDQFQIWALVDLESESIERKFVFLGTGHVKEATNLDYINSWVSDELVFHLFEVS